MAPVDSAVLGEKGEDIADLLKNGVAEQTAEVAEESEEAAQNIQGDTDKAEAASMSLNNQQRMLAQGFSFGQENGF